MFSFHLLNNLSQESNKIASMKDPEGLSNGIDKTCLEVDRGGVLKQNETTEARISYCRSL